MRINIMIEDIQVEATGDGGGATASCAIELTPAVDVWGRNTPAAIKAREMLAAAGIYGLGDQGEWNETKRPTMTIGQASEVNGGASELKLVGVIPLQDDKG